MAGKTRGSSAAAVRRGRDGQGAARGAKAKAAPAPGKRARPTGRVRVQLTDAQLEQARKRIAKARESGKAGAVGETVGQLATRLGVSPSTLRRKAAGAPAKAGPESTQGKQQS